MINYPPYEYKLPVSIADLPGHVFSVTPETLTENVVAEMENHPSLPGVMIIENDQLVGVITRLKLFERLGHRFGVELSLQKPINQLKDLIRTNIQAMPGYSRIDEAVQYALGRSARDKFDPIVVLRDDGTLQLLDINILLLAQSHAMASLSNIGGNLEQIDSLIHSTHDVNEILHIILRLLRHVVPYHQAAILAIDEMGLGFVAHSGYRPDPNRADDVMKSGTYALIMKYRLAIYIPNACNATAWRGMDVLGTPIAWLGVPLLLNQQPLGLLSISRNVERAFDSDERKTALAFAQRITELLKCGQPAASNLNELQKSLTARFPRAGESVLEQMYRGNKPLDIVIKSALGEWLKYG